MMIEPLEPSPSNPRKLPSPSNTPGSPTLMKLPPEMRTDPSAVKPFTSIAPAPSKASPADATLTRLTVAPGATMAPPPKSPAAKLMVPPTSAKVLPGGTGAGEYGAPSQGPFKVIGAGLADRKPNAAGSAIVSTLFFAGSAWNTPPSARRRLSAVLRYMEPEVLNEPFAPMTTPLGLMKKKLAPGIATLSGPSNRLDLSPVMSLVPPVTREITLRMPFGPPNATLSPVSTLKTRKLWNRLVPCCTPLDASTAILPDISAPVAVNTTSAWLAAASASSTGPSQRRQTARTRIKLAITISLAL